MIVEDIGWKDAHYNKKLNNNVDKTQLLNIINKIYLFYLIKIIIMYSMQEIRHVDQHSKSVDKGHIRMRSGASGTYDSSQRLQLITDKSIEYAEPKNKLKSLKNTFKNIKSLHIKHLKEIDNQQEQSGNIRSVLKTQAQDNQTQNDFRKKRSSMGNLERQEIVQSSNTIQQEQNQKVINDLKTHLSVRSMNYSMKQISQIEHKLRMATETIVKLSEQYEEKSKENRQLLYEIERLKDELVKKESEIKKQKNQNYKLKNQLLVEKDQYLNLEIDYEKLQFQYEILRKEQKLESPPLTSQNTLFLQQQIHKLKDTLELKDKRYELLLKELETIKNNYSKEDKDQIAIFPQTFHNYHKQIQLINSDIQEIPFKKGNKQNSEEFQQKIISLQQIISEQGAEKIKLLEEIQDLMLKYERTNQQNHELKTELKKQQKICLNLKTYVDNLENMIKMKGQDEKIPRIIKNIEIKHDSRLRAKEQHHEFELQRLKNEHKLHISNILKQQQTDRAISDRNNQYWKKQSQYWRKQHQQAKDKLLQENKQKYQQLKIMRQEYQSKLKQFQSKNPQEQLQQLKNKYESEIKMLLHRLDELIKSNEQYVKDYQKYVFLENQNAKLKERVKMGRTINVAVDHLWAIKETEYNNIHAILNKIDG